MMRRLAIGSALAVTLTACSINPFVPDHSAPPPSPAPVDQAVSAYVDCVNIYAITRIDYDVTVNELADAAIGACLPELQLVRTRYIQQTGRGAGAEVYANTLQKDIRQSVVTRIVEARNASTEPGAVTVPL